MLVKTHQNKAKKFMNSVQMGNTYLFDRVKMIINTKGEVVLTTTTSTVIREESDESDLSLELSQK